MPPSDTNFFGSSHDQAAVPGAGAFLILTLAAIFACTLVPLPAGESSQLLLPAGPFTGHDLVDGIQNIILFLPLGLALAQRRIHAVWKVLLGAVISLGIETMQLWIPGRVSSWVDVCTNATGTMVGLGLYQWPLVRTLVNWFTSHLHRVWLVIQSPSVRLGRIAVLVTLIVAIGVRAGTVLLAAPSFGTTNYSFTTGELRPTLAAVRIGGDDSPHEYFAGLIDEVRIYDRALSRAEVAHDVVTPVDAPRSSQGRGPVAAFAFSEGTGDRAHDSSGHGIDGQVVRAKWVQQGRYGSALQFDGQASHVLLPETPALNPTEGFTLEAWVFPQTPRNMWEAVVQKANDEFFLYSNSSHDAGVPRGGGHLGGTYDSTSFPWPIPRFKWVHLAVTYDGAALKMYEDGTLRDSYVRAFAGKLESARIGAANLNTDPSQEITAVHERLDSGIPLEFVVRATGYVERIAPVVLLNTADGLPLLHVGVRGDDIVVKYLSIGERLGLYAPDVKLSNTAGPLRAGTRTTLRIDGDLRAPRMSVNDGAQVQIGLTRDDWWRSFVYADALPTAVRAVITALLEALFVIPMVYFCSRAYEILLVLLVYLLALFGLELCLPLAPASPYSLAVIAGWAILAARLRHLRSASQRASSPAQASAR
jgi:VanZ family protein